MCPQKIALLTDSCADLTPALIRQNHIHVVPLRILCTDGEYRDGVDIDGEGIYRRLRAGELPQTSLPAAEDFGQALRQIVAEGYDGVIAATTPFFSVDTLEYLQKGGRIGKVTATAGALLHIKPLLTFAADGQLTSVAKVRGRPQVMDKLVELTVKACGSHRRYNLAVAHGGAPEYLETLRQKLTAALPAYDHIWEGQIDGTLSVYIGDGILGAAVQVLD